MNKKNPLSWAHPIVQEWFLTKFGSASEPQTQGWPAIVAGKSTLISAPTGSGKTFAAFLVCIDQLVRKALAGTLADQTEVVYISPLKALSNDVHKNLLEPLQEIISLANKHGLSIQEISVVVRTGDTPQKDRQAMLKRRPHIIVTTPESLYILLTATKSREMLETVKTVIVDEIHAMANSKRGSHLTLSLERLSVLCKHPLIRIGLSATQKPIEQVAQFLVGMMRPLPVIVNIGHIREMALSIEVPSEELSPVASNELWEEIYDKLATLTKTNRSTLIFANTRRVAERVAHHLTERLGPDYVRAHHGSLSRKLRLQAETKLKNGELKALVATASLELGIDIGNIDLVCQLSSPRAIAIALQRIGRAGHWRGAISKGCFFATTRDDLLECAALVHAIKEGDLDKLIIPTEPLDILAQQIVAMCVTDDWVEAELFHTVKQAYPYADLTRESFEAVIEMLSDGIAGSRGRYGAYLFRDQVNGLVKARRASRLTAIMNGGAIPETGLFTVIAEPNGVMVGTLDEDFAVESNRGDIILLGSTSWRVKRVESNSARLLVEDAHGAAPSVPFWRGEAPGRTNELSLQVSDLREKIASLIPENSPSINDVVKSPEIIHAIQWLIDHCGVNTSGAEQLLEYIRTGRAILGAVPTQQTIIAERFFDEGGGMQLIIHSPYGARINKAWGLALRKRFCRSFNFELQAAATDDGLNIALAEQHSFPLADVFRFLHPNTLKEVLVQAVLQSPLFPTRWRWDASRSLALIRYRNGKKIPPNILRMLSDDLLAAVFPDAAACQDNLAGEDVKLPDHPLINEAMKDVLTEALDVDGLHALITNILNENIKCLAIDTPLPSPFAHEILNANPYAFLDDAPLEERRARAVELRRVLPPSVLKEAGKLDAAAISEVKRQAWPDIRNADELHDLLQTLISLPQSLCQSNAWQGYLDELIHSRRVALAQHQDTVFCFAVEKNKTFASVYPEATILNDIVIIEKNQLSHEDAIEHMLRGWMLYLGPTTNYELQDLLHLPLNEIDQALLKLESTGLILRGQFRTEIEILEWCERRLLARIHRLTVGRLRKEIQPVTAAQFIQWLLRWQHVATGTQLRGEHGLLEVIKQLQGFEIPANAWESQILSKRISDYTPDLLDHLCLSGTIGWGRLSLPSSTEMTDQPISIRKRIMPTSTAAITFFVRGESDWLIPHRYDEDDMSALSHAAKAIYDYLKTRGASFFVDIVNGTHKLKTEVETGLWELVAAGIVTADGFDNLRTLITPHRRHKRRGFMPRFSTGRWSLLYTASAVADNKRIESACWMLLKRYGVVFRDLIAREKNIPRWRELLIAYRRLEDQGEVRGGRFVDGFLGEQFALPYAVDSLRAMRHEAPSESSITLAAVDPLNLIGIILPGPRVAAFSNNKVSI